VDQAAAAGECASFVHAGLTPRTSYHYALFAHDGTDNFAAAVLRDVTLGIPGDTDLDNDVDQSDFGFFQRCLSEEGVAPPVGCEDADFDADGDVDNTDLNAFRDCLRGPGRPTDC
jgi:hypothetical protein